MSGSWLVLLPLAPRFAVPSSPRILIPCIVRRRRRRRRPQRRRREWVRRRNAIVGATSSPSPPVTAPSRASPAPPAAPACAGGAGEGGGGAARRVCSASAPKPALFYAPKAPRVRILPIRILPILLAAFSPLLAAFYIARPVFLAARSAASGLCRRCPPRWARSPRMRRG